MSHPPESAAASMTKAGRVLVLIVGFLGWLGSGVHMSITQLVGQSAAIDLLDRVGSLDKESYQALNKRAKPKGPSSSTQQTLPPLTVEEQAQLKVWKEASGRWFGFYNCAFLFGAATGGLVFGALGDRWGRSKAMALSILTYSVMAGASYFAEAPWQLLLTWFLACTGTGGMWPNGVSLVAEAWSNLSRPMVSGVMGTSANIGIFLFSTVAIARPITPDDWRWVMLIGASPIVLGVIALLAVPESPRWLSHRQQQTSEKKPEATFAEIFKPPLLATTLVGIALATVPLIGGWGTANWMIPWADDAGSTASPPNLTLKAAVQQYRSITGIIGSLLGGWVANIVGRRRSYFLISLVALGIAQYIFWFVYPTDASFLPWVAALGLISGLYFGWLPLFLPELFTTRVRSTGAGVSFNFGRILTAITVFTSSLLIAQFGGDYAKLGRITSLGFALGMVAVCLAPDTSKRSIED